MLIQQTRWLADEYSVFQIFHNLIHNAIKYTNEGEIEVNAKRDENNNLIVEVRDTGIGIACECTTSCKEYLPRLFQPFSQEEQGYTRKYEGNGLGLALVKRYCEINKAAIEVNSTKGKGTTFKLTLLP
ncbi:ATP-binding protein [Melioribacteraceae bacterium 4301-Me]|uniref:ATP-binding protein n=1 Tax=Pyranulibacter aquaticus TaxID=3163344 RepID=UPI0035954D65